MSSALNINLPLSGNVGLGVGVTDATIGAAAPNANMRDNRWLTLEVCREYQRAKCSRSEQECKYAHPPPHVEVQNGRVTCCFDSIKGKCNRKDPPCKYLHPPAHLKEQLLQNGRNNLVARSMVMQQMHLLQQLSGNPTATGSSNMSVMYPSSTTLTNPSAVLTPTSTLYPSAYLNAATLGTSLNGSPSPTGTVSASSPDVTNALQSALLGASSQQSANASSAASNQLVAALLGQLATGSSSPTSAAQQQQQYRALQVQALLQAAAQQKQLFAATGVSPSASNTALLSGGVALCGLPSGATLASLQGGMSLGALQNGALSLSALSNGGLTMQNGLNNAAASSQPGSNASADANAANSANALLQSLSAYASNGSQQRNSNEQLADSSSTSGSRKRSHAESPSSATAAPASCSTANPSSGTALTGSSTNAYDLLPLDQNQLLLAAASGVPSSLSAKRVASVDARTGLPCYNPATQSQAVTMYPSSVQNAVNVNIVPSQTASLSGYQHALLAALSGLATTSTLPTAPQHSSTAALLQQPNSLAYAQPAGLSIAKIMTGSNGASSLAALPPRL